MAHAHGKVILFGEHAVVYGHPAIAAGIHRGAEASAVPADRAALDIEDQCILPGADRTGHALRALLTALGSPTVRIRASLDLPVGCGLGASAALGVAIARAIVEHQAGSLGASPGSDAASIGAAAMAWERIFHGNPSGVDTAAAQFGGCIRFSRACGVEPLHFTHRLQLAIAVAGPPASTESMVSGLAARRRASPTFVDAQLSRIGEIAERGLMALTAGNLLELGGLMSENHAVLAGLGLSTPELERARSMALTHGALGAKLTGAGGGGCVIALADPSPEPILRAWASRGIRAFATTVATSTEGSQP